MEFSFAGLIFMFCLGAVIGSFLNVVICRVPARELSMQRVRAWADLGYDSAAESEYTSAPPTIVAPRSHCPHCKTPIANRHLVPVLSWLWLRGKAACCGMPISPRYPAIELATGALWTASAWHFGFGVELAAVLLFISTLIALAIIDLEHSFLPDIILIPLLWIGLAVNSQGVLTTLQSAVLAAIAGYLVLWTVRSIHSRLTGRIGLGLGDCKLFACAGAWLGLDQLLPLLTLATGGALIFLLPVVLSGLRPAHHPFPLGPWLAGSAMFCLAGGHYLSGLLQ